MDRDEARSPSDGGHAGDAGRMRAYHLVRPGELCLETAEIPVPTDGEIVARVSLALTCGTDLKTYRRGHVRLKVPGPLGHEWAGRVQALGAGVSGFQIGDRVVATPTAPCGDCAYCIRGDENLCLHLFDHTAMGAYAEYILIPRHIVNRNTFRIPDDLSDGHAALLEPLACVVHGAERVELAGDLDVLFLGDGPIALLFSQVARLRGAGRVIMVGRHERRLEVARQAGVDVVVDGSRTDPLQAVQQLTDGLGADVVVECVGRRQAWEEAIRLVRRGGQVLLFGGCEKGTQVGVDAERLHYDEIDLKGAFHYTPDSVRRAWDLLRSGALKVDPLVDDRVRLEALPEVFERMSRREVLKVAIVP